MGVYKKNNRWYADYYVDGKRKREVVKIEGIPPDKVNRQDALKFLHIKKAEVAQGTYVAQKAKPVLFDKIAHAFIEGYSKANKKSWTRDVTSCRALGAYFGGKKLTQITPWTVDKYKLKRLKDNTRFRTPVAKATINRELACLKTMLSYAVGEGWLMSNPLNGYKLFQEPPKKFRVVSEDEFARVYKEASEFLKPILITAVNTGMRMREILSLRWVNVNLRDGNIFVEETKSGDSRFIPIN